MSTRPRHCCTERRARVNASRGIQSKHCTYMETNGGSSASDSEVEPSPFVGRYTGSAGCSVTESVRQVDTICGVHTYTVVGYTLARAMGPGTRLCSDLFDVGGQLFRLEVYPAGLDQNTYKYVSLFLTTPGTTRPGHLLYEVSILDQSQSKPQHIAESRTAFIPSSFEAAAATAPHPGVVAGFPKFIKANFLHRNPRRFLPDDTLTIRATVKVLTGRSSFPTAPAPQLFLAQPNPATPPPPLHHQLLLHPAQAPAAAHPQHVPSIILPSPSPPCCPPFHQSAPGTCPCGCSCQAQRAPVPDLAPVLACQPRPQQQPPLAAYGGYSGEAMGICPVSPVMVAPPQLALQPIPHHVSGQPVWAGARGPSWPMWAASAVQEC